MIFTRKIEKQIERSIAQEQSGDGSSMGALNLGGGYSTHEIDAQMTRRELASRHGLAKKRTGSNRAANWLSDADLLRYLPSKPEYDFVLAARLTEQIDHDSLRKLSKKFNIPDSRLSHLIDTGVLPDYKGKDSNVKRFYADPHKTDLKNIEKSSLSVLERDGSIEKLSPRVSKFLDAIRDRDIYEESIAFQLALKAHRIDSTELSKLKHYGIVNVLERKDFFKIEEAKRSDSLREITSYIEEKFEDAKSYNILKSRTSIRSSKISVDRRIKVNSNGFYNYYADKMYIENTKFRELKDSLSSKDTIDHYHTNLKNNDFFFLDKISYKDDINSVRTLASKFGSNVENLKSKGYIDFLTEKEVTKIKALCEHGHNASQSELAPYVNRGFVSVLEQEDEKKISAALEYAQDDLEKLDDALHAVGLSDAQLNSFQTRGHLSYLKPDELKLADEIQDRKLSFKDLRNSIFESNIENKIDFSKRVTYHYRVAKAKTSLSNIEAPNTTFSSPGKALEWIKKSGIESRDMADFSIHESHAKVDRSINYDPSSRLNLGIKKRYREDISVSNNRDKWKTSYNIGKALEDIDIHVKSIQHPDRMSKKELLRMLEYRCAREDLKSIYIPTNAEKLFLKKADGRDISAGMDLLYRVANDDFGICKKGVERLVSFGYLTSVQSSSEDNKTVARNSWRDPASIEKLRQGDKDPEVLKLLDISEATFRHVELQKSILDYSIYFKSLRREILTKKELSRAEDLNDNGLNVNSDRFKAHIHEDPSSWRLKKAKKNEFVKHYKKLYEVPVEALKTLNTFKQMTKDHLIAFGMTEDQFNLCANGVDDKGTYRLLNKATLSIDGNRLDYYFLSHEGPISGRRILETYIDPGDISKRPQNRKDLLYHDLKVVDSVIDVVKEMRKKGYNLKAITPESEMFSQAKKGKANTERSDSLTFLDANLVFEDIKVPSGGGSTVEIGVEYGNYKVQRMAHKLENAKFDQAYVYGDQRSVELYQKKIFTKNVVFRSI